MNRKHFFDELCGHDWFYSFSDDHTAYNHGYQERLRLEKIAEEDETLKRMLKDFIAHKYSGDSWETPRKPKPEFKDYEPCE